MKIGFALIPDEDFLNNFIGCQWGIQDDFDVKLSYSLGNETNLPHITLFQGDLDTSRFDYKEVLEKVKAKWFEQGVNNLVFKNVIYKQKGWLFHTVEKTLELEKLHLITLALIKDYTILCPNRFNLEEVELYSVYEYKALELYGYKYTRKSFLPHITIGRLIEEFDKNTFSHIVERFSNLPREFGISKLTVYEMGEDGRHKSILYETSI